MFHFSNYVFYNNGEVLLELKNMLQKIPIVTP